MLHTLKQVELNYISTSAVRTSYCTLTLSCPCSVILCDDLLVPGYVIPQMN